MHDELLGKRRHDQLPLSQVSDLSARTQARKLPSFRSANVHMSNTELLSSRCGQKARSWIKSKALA